MDCQCHGPGCRLDPDVAARACQCNGTGTERPEQSEEVRAGHEDLVRPGEAEAALEQELLTVGGDDLAGAAKLNAVESEPGG